MKIAFCKYGGLAAGGTEKYLQSLALLYKEAGHEVDYFYTNATPIEGTNWQHPDTCPARKELVESAGINTKLVQLSRRRSAADGAGWVDTNFFDLFDESKYDRLVTAGDGRPEFPYTKLGRVPIIHTIHGWHVYNAPNIRKSVLLCNWQANQWKANGGDTSKLEVIPSLIPIPRVDGTGFRESIGVPADALVFGLHQAPGVPSLVSLNAFSQIVRNNTYYVILGGDQQHRQFVQSQGIKNVIFLPVSGVETVHAFLESIDVYAHCRRDGEVCSASLIEAMAHGKPIVSHYGDGTNLGHLEQVRGIGAVTDSVGEYAAEMSKFFDTGYRAELAKMTYERYLSVYEYSLVASRFRGLL